MALFEIELWGNTLGAYLSSIGVAVGALLVGKLAEFWMKRFWLDKASQTKNKIDDVFAKLGSKPFFWLIFSVGSYGGINLLNIPNWLDKRTFQVFVVVWGIIAAVSFVRLINASIVALIETKVEQEDSSLYLNILKTSRSFVNVIVGVIAAIFVIANLGFDVSAVIAGLGIGGLALALASKDTLANIFGSITILVNGPFRVGEAVSYQGHDGVVEEVGIRDTRIRTWKGHLVVIPNSMAPTSVIENISRRPSVRELFQIPLSNSSSSAQIDLAQEIIKNAIDGDERIVGEAKVHFVEFGESAIKLQVLYFIKDPAVFLDAKHEINRRIVDALGKAKIPLAVPAISVVQTATESSQ